MILHMILPVKEKNIIEGIGSHAAFRNGALGNPGTAYWFSRGLCRREDNSRFRQKDLGKHEGAIQKG